MLVVDMAVIVPVVIVTMLMVAMHHMSVFLDVSMAVVMMVVPMTGMIVVSSRSEGHRRHRPRRLQRTDESAALGPDQPGAEAAIRA